MADTSKGVTEVQALTPEELAVVREDAKRSLEYYVQDTIRRLLATIDVRDKRIEELEAQLKELTSDIDEKFEDK